MPFKILLSIALIYIGTLSSIGQNIELSGQVKAADGVVLEFVNIGIQNKDIGTVSDKNGLFFLNIPPSNQKDSITVSYVGYFNKTLSIEEMIKKSPETILLKLNPFQLDEVIINNSEKKELKLGTQSYSNWVVGYVKSKNDSNNDIQEFVKKIKIKKASQVLNVNINLFNIKQETAIFRVNFYNVKD
ncbi:hypothetical protein AEQU3_03003 [Aequorivita antarctica]|nr:hypothetical protein AEQU3_03003 [Aequorivita antarctica]